MKQTVIFDLDGTLAIIEERRKLATFPDGKMNWKAFFNPVNIGLDEPNWPVINTFKALQMSGFTVGIFSGRDDISKDTTIKWISMHGINPAFLKMRKSGTFTPDDKLKKMWLDDLIQDGHNVMCVFDDRDKVVKMWRDNGISCFQVNYGNF